MPSTCLTNCTIF